MVRSEKEGIRKGINIRRGEKLSEIKTKVIRGKKRYYKVLPNGMWRFVKGPKG